MRIAPFGHLRINACLPLPEAFRSLPRPSSAPDAKAFSLRSFQLKLSFAELCLDPLKISFKEKLKLYLPIFRSFTSLNWIFIISSLLFRYSIFKELLLLPAHLKCFGAFLVEISGIEPLTS